jgi:co-chaperonin GroES (HSP10)
MQTYPVGARCWVEDIQPVDEVKQWTARTGLVAVQFENDAPRPTTGKVVAVGNDPYLNEVVKVGDIVFFQRFAGTGIVIQGKQLRVLEVHEITSVARGTPEELKNLVEPPSSPTPSSS